MRNPNNPCFFCNRKKKDYIFQNNLAFSEFDSYPVSKFIDGDKTNPSTNFGSTNGGGTETSATTTNTSTSNNLQTKQP